MRKEGQATTNRWSHQHRPRLRGAEVAQQQPGSRLVDIRSCNSPPDVHEEPHGLLRRASADRRALSRQDIGGGARDVVHKHRTAQKLWVFLSRIHPLCLPVVRWNDLPEVVDGPTDTSDRMHVQHSKPESCTTSLYQYALPQRAAQVVNIGINWSQNLEVC